MDILIIYDVDGWAWHRNAQAIQNYLPQYNIEISRGGRKGPPIHSFDHIHYCGWVDAIGRASQVSAGITSHNFIRSKRAKDGFEEFWPKFKALTANSKILYDIAKPYNENLYLTPNGVHEDIFYPVKKERNKNLVVGWVGQTNGADLLKHENGAKIDIKGYNLVLKKLMKELEGQGIEFKVNGKLYKKAVPYDQMPSFFNSVDVQICTSYREGTPNPLFEASACGKAIISTRVGAIAECIEDGVNGFITDAYSREEDLPQTIQFFKEKLLFLRDNRDECEEMGEKGRAIIEQDWTWRERSKDWIPLFEDMNK